MTDLNPQLANIVAEIERATADARTLVTALDDEGFQQRPAEHSWSVAECIEHLSLTTRSYLPLLDEALNRSKPEPAQAEIRYRRDLIGWLMCWFMEPPFRTRTKTIAAFDPSSLRGRAETLADFESLQDELKRRVARSHGYPITRITIVSPFNARMKYNLYSCLELILAHERRHLWQASNVVSSLSPKISAAGVGV